MGEGRETVTGAMHVVVRGRVQGVGFRWFVRERARRLGLVGWVRNRDDGCVEVHAEGAADALDRLRQDLRTGPSGAKVSGLDEEHGSPDVAAMNPFEILK
jgi:acylphosphatase